MNSPGYARVMADPTQVPPAAPPAPDAFPPPPAANEAADPAGAPATGESPAPAAIAGAPEFGAERIQRGLLLWLAIVTGGALLVLLPGHAEAALLFAGAAAFALAQGTDAAAALASYREFVHGALPRESFAGALPRLVVRALVPIAGAGFYAGLAAAAWQMEPSATRVVALAWCALAVLVCLALAWRPFADLCMRACFRGEPGRTRRLTARLIVMLLLLPVAGVTIFPHLLAQMPATGHPLVDAPGLLAQLAGELAIGLAGVGLLVRRDWRSTLDRLGLGPLRQQHVIVVVLGVGAACALNTLTEAIEKRFLPGLYRQDVDATLLIASHLPLWTGVLLGVAAGFGEEIPLRGALQPRLGIVFTSLVFASGHVQYSWYGMLTVALLGMLLGTIRARTNTTTAIAVHVIYDILAVFTGGS